MASGYRVRLDLRPVSNLHPHEETIDSNTREMVAQLQRDGIQKDPVIVDDKSGVVLDGMHRLSAFSKLGIRNALCHPVAYMDASITVGRWLRVYRAPGEESPGALPEAVGLTSREPASEALRKIDGRITHVAAFAGGAAFIPPDSRKIEDGFGVLRKSDEFARSRGWARTFVSEPELREHANEPSEVVLMVGRFGKEDVLRAGTAGHLFPAKTSMHFVDPRPVGVNMALSELVGGPERKLHSIPDGRSFRLLPPDSVYEGRRYKERLLLMSGA